MLLTLLSSGRHPIQLVQHLSQLRLLPMLGRIRDTLLELLTF
jgi:hypothetical protein